MQYVYDKYIKYIDMTSHNIVVSVGHSSNCKENGFDQIEKLPLQYNVL